MFLVRLIIDPVNVAMHCYQRRELTAGGMMELRVRRHLQFVSIVYLLCLRLYADPATRDVNVLTGHEELHFTHTFPFA